MNKIQTIEENSKKKTFGIQEMYSWYKKNTKKPLDEQTYKYLLDEYNERCIEELCLQGYKFYFKPDLAYIQIYRDTPRGKVVNFNETKKQRELTGDNSIIVYHIQDYYCFFNWKKSKVKAPNKSIYTFKILIRHKKRLGRLLQQNDLAYKEFINIS